jgi:hypothetical protein
MSDDSYKRVLPTGAEALDQTSCMTAFLLAALALIGPGW